MQTRKKILDLLGLILAFVIVVAWVIILIRYGNSLRQIWK